ncbi:MAG: hypothetical protein EPN53_01030 [Acidobacteria bacterium]|nr:MAG: hypothetical protein EPN53_01030 [Acidobacteriota bacterium]
MSGKVKQNAVVDVAGLLGADVELRCAGGQIFRGALKSVGRDYLALERATTGRTTLVTKANVVAIVDERAPGLALAGRRAAEAALDRAEGE